MKTCQKCGAPLEDNCLFCTSCGTNQDNINAQPQQPQQPEKKSKTRVILSSLAGIIVAVIVSTIIKNSFNTTTNTTKSTTQEITVSYSQVAQMQEELELRGSVSGNMYFNDWACMLISIPSDYTDKTETERKNITSGILGLYIEADGGENLGLMIDNSATFTDEQKYLDLTMSAIFGNEKTYTSGDVTSTRPTSYTTKTIGGETYYCAKVEMSSSKYSTSVNQYYIVRILKGKAIVFVLTGYSDTECDEMLKNIK